MNYNFEKLVSVFSVIIGRFLGLSNPQMTYSRQDTIKLKRLLYNLMEPRYWMQKELQLDEQLTEILDLFIIEIQKRIPLPPDEL